MQQSYIGVDKPVFHENVNYQGSLKMGLSHITTNHQKICIAFQILKNLASSQMESMPASNNLTFQSRILSKKSLLKENVRNFQKLKSHQYLIKYYIKQKRSCLKILFSMFLPYFIFVISHSKIHPAVHLNTSKALTSLQSKRKI